MQTDLRIVNEVGDDYLLFAIMLQFFNGKAKVFL